MGCDNKNLRFFWSVTITEAGSEKSPNFAFRQIINLSKQETPFVSFFEDFISVSPAEIFF